MKVLALAILTLVCLVLFCGCGFETESQKSAQPEKLPTGATSITDKGNGWTTFQLDGNTFLYHRSHSGYYGFEAITAISPKTEE